MAFPHDGKKFKNGKTGNPNGAPKGKRKKGQLIKIIKDAIDLGKKDLTSIEKHLIYQLYEIALSDYVCEYTSSDITHLYFIESDFGIKIGFSKNVSNRLNQIRMYAPSSQILKIIPFAGNFEKSLHNKFKKQNIKNNPTFGVEWFYKNEDLMSFIGSIENVKDLANVFGSKSIGQLIIPF